MNKINLPLLAEHLPAAWHSSILGQAAGANIKVLRMDGAAYPSEVHDFDEALLVISGVMQLEVASAVSVCKPVSWSSCQRVRHMP